MTQFTPGPWRVSRPQQTPFGIRWHILHDTGAARWGVAHVSSANQADIETQFANAQLIAAAPQLLAVLEEVSPLLTETQRQRYNVDAVVALAKGEA